MKNFERILFIVGFAFLILASLLSQKKLKDREKQKIYDLRSIEASSDYVRRFEIASNGIDLNHDLQLISNKNDTLTLEQLLHNHARLILKLPDSECSICIDTIQHCLSEVFKNGPDHLIILASANSLKSINLTYKNNPFFRNIYSSPSLDTIIPAFEEGLTSFLYMDNNMMTRHFFIPDRNDANKTRWYLEFVNQKYFEP